MGHPYSRAVLRSPLGTLTGAADPSTRPLLQQSDFTYLGHYGLANAWGGSSTQGLTSGGGLTGRYRNGILYLMSLWLSNGTWRLGEFRLPPSDGQPTVTGGANGGTFGNGDTTDFVNYWDTPWGAAAPMGNGSANTHLALNWEESQQRMWTSFAHDYSDGSFPQPFWGDTNTLSTCVRGLVNGTPGSITNFKGSWGLQGITDCAQYGGVLPVPIWWQNKYAPNKPYAIVGGGYASQIASKASNESFGLALRAIADPTGLAASADITNFVTGADFGFSICTASPGGFKQDWFTSAAGANLCYNGLNHPTNFDRGVRQSLVSNGFDIYPDGGVLYWNGPAPDDGLQRWCWGDGYDGCHCWIDGPNKNGYVTIMSCVTGTAFYQASQFQSNSCGQEFQVFDPNDFGKIVNGTISPPWKLKPSSRWITTAMSSNGLNYGYDGSGGSMGKVRGAWFDVKTNLLYAISNGDNAWQSIYIWKVNN